MTDLGKGGENFENILFGSNSLADWVAAGVKESVFCATIQTLSDITVINEVHTDGNFPNKGFYYEGNFSVNRHNIKLDGLLVLGLEMRSPRDLPFE